MVDIKKDSISLLGIFIEITSIIIIASISSFGVYKLFLMGSWIAITGSIILGAGALLIIFYIICWTIGSFHFLIRSIFDEPFKKRK